MPSVCYVCCKEIADDLLLPRPRVLEAAGASRTRIATDRRIKEVLLDTLSSLWRACEDATWGTDIEQGVMPVHGRFGFLTVSKTANAGQHVQVDM